MPIPPPTAEELIATLKRSSLPTLLVEGACDAQVYRHLEDALSSFNVSTLPCGGRTTLLKIHDRRAEIIGTTVAFLADKDMRVFGTPPTEYSDIIWTSGYSIENDIYKGETLEKLMSPVELAQFRQLVDAACQWFAFCVEELTAGRTAHVAISLSRLVPPGTTELDKTTLTQFAFREPQAQMHEFIARNYATHLRGKTLFEALLRILSAATRASKYSFPNLIEICIKIDRSPGVSRLLEQIASKLNPPDKSPGRLSST